MVKTLLIAALLTMHTFSAANGIEEEEDDFNPSLQESGLPEVVRVSVSVPSEDVQKEMGIEHTPGDPDCSQFRVTEKDIHTYLSIAHKISRQDFMHVIEWSPCQAVGSVEFADGLQAKWRVQQYGGGTLFLPKGEEMHLFCDRCSEPFLTYWEED